MPDQQRSIKGRIRDLLPDEVGDRLELAREIARYEKDRLTWVARGVAPRASVGTLLFWPDLPTHYHAIWKLAAASGYRITNDPAADVDAVVRFIDTTWWEPDEVLLRHAEQRPVINLRCSDISKSTISEANLVAFGRQLGVDPTTHTGTIVVKSEANATHDGVLVQGPLEAVDPEMSYQRLVDNELRDRPLYEVIRTPVIDGHVPLVHRKLRGGDNRLDDGYDDAQLHRTEDFLSEQEVAGVLALTRHINMEYGEVDVLRDIGGDGQIYVVDANNTPWGPPLHQAEDQRRRAVEIMAPVFHQMIQRRIAGEATTS